MGNIFGVASQMMRTTVAVIAILVAPVTARAWGDAGHKVVCEIALSLVSPGTYAEIGRLIKLGGKFSTFPEACTWPDHPRKRAAEHFVNLPRDATALSAPCGSEPVCVVSAIIKDFAVLSSKASSDVEKSASLKFLGHWVGDVHQPLHVSFKNDRGGNSVKVSGECGNGNLHSVWDSCLVNAAIGGDAHAGAGDLLKSITRAQMDEWAHSTPVDWANESFGISERAQTQYCERHGQSCDAHDGTVTVDQAYIRANVPVVREQLQRAGVRLAHLLDQALSK
jgi:hypothetical protein